MAKKKTADPTDWKSSKAKQLLEKDLKEGTIPLTSAEMSPKIVYHQREEFRQFDYEHFRNRLNDLRKRIRDKNNRASAESAALAHDRRIHPKATHNHRGEPRWEGSDAERLLRLDMDQGMHKIMKPQELWSSRKEYYENYSKDVFRGHIYQEEQRRKFLSYVKNK